MEGHLNMPGSDQESSLLGRRMDGLVLGSFHMLSGSEVWELAGVLRDFPL